MARPDGDDQPTLALTPVLSPAPAGVPVSTTSPGSSVTCSLIRETSSGTGQIMSLVLACCLSSPFSVPNGTARQGGRHQAGR